jgi:hypothetical protein
LPRVSRFCKKYLSVSNTLSRSTMYTQRGILNLRSNSASTIGAGSRQTILKQSRSICSAPCAIPLSRFFVLPARDSPRIGTTRVSLASATDATTSAAQSLMRCRHSSSCQKMKCCYSKDCLHGWSRLHCQWHNGGSRRRRPMRAISPHKARLYRSQFWAWPAVGVVGVHLSQNPDMIESFRS